MTTRERNLATILLGVLCAAGSFLLFKVVYLDKKNVLDKQLAEKDRELSNLQKEIKKERDYVAGIGRLSPRLAQWQKVSLPDSDASTEAARTAHLSRMSLEYARFLQGLLAGAGFKVKDFKPPDPRSLASATVNIGTGSNRKPLFNVLTYEIDGESKLEGVVKFFEDLYRTTLLHQVRKFTITPQQSAKESGTLLVKMTIEALLVVGAEKISADKRPGIFPKFDNKDKAPLVLAKDKRDYQAITRKNIFAPPREVVVEREIPTGPEPEAAEQVLPAVMLTMISFSEYYDAWIAQIHNQGNKKANTAILIDQPLPKGTRFQKDKEAAQKAKSPLPLEPVSRWAIKDRYQETLMELNIVRIEPLRIIFQADGEFYSFKIGTYMSEADPMDADTLKELGLLGDPNATFKQVLLKELVFKKDRKTFEGHFVNPENKDEKETLSTEALPEDFSVPDTWRVKDKFGTELLKMVVVKMEKDRAIFTVDKKYYAFKVNGNLHDAMQKPLTEAEVKELKLAAK